LTFPQHRQAPKALGQYRLDPGKGHGPITLAQTFTNDLKHILSNLLVDSNINHAVIASTAKQSVPGLRAGDCFVALLLAMTNEKSTASKRSPDREYSKNPPPATHPG
jgi:hypothetical protein